MPRTTLINRRHLLRGAGGAALGLPLLQAMMPSRARAAEKLGKPKRFIVLFSGNGYHLEKWRPANVSADGRKFSLSPILAPLAPIRQDCLLLDGLPYNSVHDKDSCAAAHPGGTAAALTGTWSGPGKGFAGGHGSCNGAGPPVSASIDHAIAQTISQDTPIPYLHASVLPPAGFIPFSAGNNQPLVPQHDPKKIYDRLFRNLGDPTASFDQNAARQAGQKRVLDAVSGAYKRLNGRLAGPDRAKLDQHLFHLEALEKSLAQIGPSTEVCKAPPLPQLDAISDPGNMPALARAQIDLIAMAMACDITRVAGLLIMGPGAPSSPTYTFLGHDTSHHDITHMRGDAPLDRMVDIGKWQSEQFLYLVQALKAHGIFDDTVVLWASELGNAARSDHGHKNNVFTLATGDPAFAPGRSLRFAGDDSTSHNRLLVSLSQWSGSDNDTFGAKQYCEGGALPGLLQ